MPTLRGVLLLRAFLRCPQFAVAAVLCLRGPARPAAAVAAAVRFGTRSLDATDSDAIRTSRPPRPGASPTRPGSRW